MSTSVSTNLFALLRRELVMHPPFAQMSLMDVDYFLSQAQQQYFAPGEILVEPASGVVQQLFYLRQGSVSGRREVAGQPDNAFAYEAGSLIPLSAAMGERAVTASYRAEADTFVLIIPVAAMRELASRSPVFAAFLSQRIAHFLELSRQALQTSYAAQALTEQSLERPLNELLGRTPMSCTSDTPLSTALTQMHEQRVGSMLVTNAHGQAVGILTRYDILGRVTLAQLPLHTPISEVMVTPVLSLSEHDTALDAALLMSRHGIRHVPVLRAGVAVGLVSERDLFALQRSSLKTLSTAIRSAPDLGALQQAARDIRGLARNLLGQGVQARQLTRLISHMNDVLTQRLLTLCAQAHSVDLRRLCWLALGSEGREEQTISTDQDNALILPNDTTQVERENAHVFALAVNQGLDTCGYPLCKGGVMASAPLGCLTLDEWRGRFGHWIDHGSPQDLLNASIYFDFRALAGDAQLAQVLGQEMQLAAQRTPRFLMQLGHNALSRGVPLNWRGAIDCASDGTLDLKLQGTALFVDAARIYSLALGAAQCGTQQRLQSVGPLLQLAPSEYEAWVGGFEFLQMLRLRVQLDGAALPEHPNRLRVDSLNDIDRRILRESLRVARQLRQRLQMDYERE